MKNDANQAQKRIWNDEAFLGNANQEAFPMCKNCLFRNKEVENGYQKGVCYLYRRGKDIKPYKLYKRLVTCPYKVIDDESEVINLDGGPGSGHWGHAGRPGEIGGSTEGGGVAFRLTTPSGGFTGLNGAYKENEKHNKAKESKSKATNKPKTCDPKADIALAVKNFKSNFNGPIPFPEISEFVKSKEMLTKLMQFPKGTEIKYGVNKVTFNGKDWIGPGNYVNDEEDLINISYGVVQGMLGKGDLVINQPAKETSTYDKIKQIKDILVKGAATGEFDLGSKGYNNAKEAIHKLPEGSKVLVNGVTFVKKGLYFKQDGKATSETDGSLGAKLMKAISFGHAIDIKVPEGSDFISPNPTNNTTPINPVPKSTFRLPKIFKNTPMATTQESWDSMIEVSHKVWNQCSKDAQAAIRHYTGTGYEEINDILRDFEEGSIKYRTMVNDITNSIAKSSYSFDKQLVRGVGEHALKSMLGAAGQDLNVDFATLSSKELNDVLKNKPMKELAFASCGSSKGSGFHKKVQLHILAPAGTQMMYVHPFSTLGYNLKTPDIAYLKSVKNYGGEDETILQQGTEFRCYGAEKDEHDNIHVYLKVTKQTPKKL